MLANIFDSTWSSSERVLVFDRSHSSPLQSDPSEKPSLLSQVFQWLLMNTTAFGLIAANCPIIAIALIANYQDRPNVDSMENGRCENV